MVEELVKGVHKTVKNITDDYEIIVVEHCSSDNSWSKIEKIPKNDQNEKGYQLSRNFRQYYAITCGLRYVSRRMGNCNEF
ncbi:glycosyltransferase [Polaribacter litorisediminis]|uniref:glycosyltransferase n=1 Tax=Polaribacter litorisediminis TaxID=1908341 RepID=UPI001CBCE63D|nr:glycosyltransferase [Polaribacter litorisediminis]